MPESPLFHSRMIRPAGRGGTCLKQPCFTSDDLPDRAGAHLPETTLFHSRMIRPVVGGGAGLALKQPLFHSRMIRPVVQGGGGTCLKQPRSSSGCDLWNQFETKRLSSICEA